MRNGNEFPFLSLKWIMALSFQRWWKCYALPNLSHRNSIKRNFSMVWFLWPEYFNRLMVVRADWLLITFQFEFEFQSRYWFSISEIGMGKLKTCGVYFSRMWFILIAIQCLFRERDDLDSRLSWLCWAKLIFGFLFRNYFILWHDE